ncbi:FtsK/SpoIIIE domain-containing protein [Nesterenkonia aethiopica]|uniref:FtsK domain-containing protein n=3 Tax=Actinomycetes TaxID=1760 RepID=A0ABP6LNT7_9MICC
MSMSLTVVRAPGALSEARWRELRDQSPGHGVHDIRLRVDGTSQPSGAQLAEALATWMGRCDAPVTGVVDGIPLATLPRGARQIHPGMVVVLHPGDTPPAGPGHGSLAAQPGGAAPALQLCLDEGPDAGRLVPLLRGRYTVGRGSVDIAVADPDIAREHCVIDVGERAVTVSSPDQPQGGRGAVRWSDSEPLQVGDSTLRLLTDGPPPASQGSWPPPPVAVDEDPPEGKHRMMLVMACVPLLVGIVLVLVTGMWFFLLFSAVSALVAAATVVDAARRRRKFRAAVDAAAGRWADRSDALLDTPGDLIRRLREPPGLSPGPASAAPHDAANPSAAARAQDSAAARRVPVVRLGHGITRPAVDTPASTRRVDAVSVHSGVGAPLRPGEVVHLAGPRRLTRRLLRWFLAQLVIRPRPHRPEIHLLAEPSQWPRVLLDDHGVGLTPGEQADVADLPTVGGPAVLLVDVPVPTELIDAALLDGWCVVHVDEPPGPYPAGEVPGWEIDLTTRNLRRVAGAAPASAADEPSDRSTDDADPTLTAGAHDLVADGVSRQTLDQLLRLALPRGGPIEGTGQVPERLEMPLPADLMSRSASTSLTSVLGRSATGEEHLDLVEDGPHILLAGTSGSGKSELLKALLLGWAARYSPTELSLVLFDFKGGATFQHLTELEHSLALITDLSQAQAERTLEGIRSELVRRERLFLDAGAGDYPEYRRLRPDDPLARILVVIDEFRIFSHELPETMDELMRLATLGRSLGLHLVLSTQRPQGVVTADIRANIGSIVTLRLRSEDESRDLVGTVEAGRIPRNLPGRGILRRPGDESVVFQTGLLSTAEAPVALRPADHRPLSRTVSATGASTFDVVAALGRAVDAGGLTRRHTPLLPPLPETIDADAARGGRSGPPALGRLDLPAEQDQVPLLWSPRQDGSLGLIGEGGSGGREAVAALAAQLLRPPSTADAPAWQVHLLDGDRSLQTFAADARVASLLTDEDMPEVVHLLQLLVDELTSRRTDPSLRTTEVPEIVVLVSGYPQWHQSLQGPSGGMLEHLLGTLISDGADVGISVLLSGGRELASGRVGSRLPRRIYLPHGVSQDTQMLWPRLRPVDPLPGRGVLISPGHPSPGVEVQLASSPISAETDPADEGAPGAVDTPSVSVRPLPQKVRLHDLLSSAQEHRSPDAPGDPVIGVAQFTQAPVLWRRGPATLILGAPGTGRSTCLEVLRQVLPDATLLSPQGTWTEEPETTTVLLDDADQLDVQRHRSVDRWIQSGIQVVGAAQPSGSLYSQIPWSHHARSAPGNILLSPTHRSQGDFFATSVPVLDRPIPGRAVQLGAEGPRMIQWALPG